LYATGNLIDYDRTGRLCEIALPTLYTCGRHDEATPEATAWYCSLTPAAKMLVFEHSAHMPHLEESDTYLAALRAFLDPATFLNSAGRFSTLTTEFSESEPD
jgi:proline iminopeptidase